MISVQLFYGHLASNWGDLAINSGVVELLRRINADLPASSVSLRWPSESYLELGVDSYKPLTSMSVPLDASARGTKKEVDCLVNYWANPMEFARDVNMARFDAVYINSGEQFFESSTGENTLDLLWRVLPIVAGYRLGKPVVLLPSTLGPFRSKFGVEVQRLLRHALSGGSFREVASVNMVRGKEFSKWPVLLDPAFFLKPPADAGGSNNTGERIGLVVRVEDAGLRVGSKRSAFVQQKFKSSGFKDSQAFKLYLRLGEHYMKEGQSVRIIVQTKADRPVSQALYEQLSATFPNGCVEYVDPPTMNDFIRELWSNALIFTSRFHTAILSLSKGIPCVGVYSSTHGHKMKGLFDSFRACGCAVRLDERDVGVVAKELREAADQISTSMESIQWRIRIKRQETLHWMQETISSSPSNNFFTERLQLAALQELYAIGGSCARSEALAEARALLRSSQPTSDSGS